MKTQSNASIPQLYQMHSLSLPAVGNDGTLVVYSCWAVLLRSLSADMWPWYGLRMSHLANRSGAPKCQHTTWYVGRMNVSGVDTILLSGLFVTYSHTQHSTVRAGSLQMAPPRDKLHV